MRFLDWISKRLQAKTNFLRDPSHPAQLTRVQRNTKSFFSKASVKRIKMPKFLLGFIEGV